MTAVCLALLGTAVLATLRGADRSRSPLDASQHVTDTLSQALAEGNRSPAVLAKLRRLRTELGHRPLDSKSRVRYAALLLSMTRTLDDTRAAAFHARAAAELAPVTFPVVELAAMILARSGDRAEALALVRHAFEFDPPAAADLLLQLEGTLANLVPHEVLADTPRAWIAWARTLTDNGRGDESIALLREAVQRWPDDLELLVVLSRRVAAASDWDALERWVQGLDPIPIEGHGLELLAYRARVHAERGRRAEAEADLTAVLSASGAAPHVLLLAGETQQRLGSIDAARRTWNRALFLTSTERPTTRVAVLTRLAELEEADGRASVALRHWRAVLELDPSHERARRRLAALTGLL